MAKLLTPEEWREQFEELKARHKRPYAFSTQRNCDLVEKNWMSSLTSYCEAAELGDPSATLRNGAVEHLKGFFVWLVSNSARGQQAVSLQSYFKRLKQLYTAATEEKLNDKIADDVDTYIVYHLDGKKPTHPYMKPVPSGRDLADMLEFLYCEDNSRFPDERQRVQQAFLMMVHGYCGLRPSSTTNTGVPLGLDVAEKNAALEKAVPKIRYRDMTLFLIREKAGATRIGVHPTFRRFKGEINRVQWKTFTWLDQANPITCPLAHLVALALHDKAFKSPNITRAQDLFSLTIEKGKRKSIVAWHEDIMDRPIFRMSGDQELTSNVAYKRLHKLGVDMGFRESLTWYCFRRLVLNVVDGVGSEETRNLIAGHLTSQTYREAYHHASVTIDTVNAVRTEWREDDLVAEAVSMGIRRDPRVNVPLTAADHDEIDALPDVKALAAECDRTHKELVSAYGRINQAPKSDPRVLQHRRAQGRLQPPRV